MAGYQDYQALADVLAAIGTPAQGTGANSIASMIAQLNTVITNTQDTVNNLATALTKLDGVITQIQTGSPSIKSPVLVASGGFPTAISVPAGSDVIEGPFTVTGTSYTLRMNFGQGAGGTIPFCAVVISMFDQNGFTLETVTYDLPMSTTATNTEYVFHGPLSTNSMQIRVHNYDTVASTFLYSLTSSNIDVALHSVFPLAFTTIAGFNDPPETSSARGIIVSAYTGPFANGTSQGFIIPPFNGSVVIGMRSDSAAVPFVMTINGLTSQNNFNGLGHGNFVALRTDANGLAMATTALPRAACQVSISNVGSASSALSYTMLAEYSSE